MRQAYSALGGHRRSPRQETFEQRPGRGEEVSQVEVPDSQTASAKALRCKCTQHVCPEPRKGGGRGELRFKGSPKTKYWEKT